MGEKSEPDIDVCNSTRRIWDTSTGQCLRTLVHEDNPPITSVCFAPNGRYVLAFSSDSCLRLWDYVSGEVKKTYQGHENGRFSIGGCFGILKNDNDDDGEGNKNNNDDDGGSNGNSNDNSDNATGKKGGQAFIAAASEDGDVVLWDVKTKEVVQRIRRAHDGVCFWVDVHGDTMVSAGQDGKIKVYRHQRPGRKLSTSKSDGTAAKAIEENLDNESNKVKEAATDGTKEENATSALDDDDDGKLDDGGNSAPIAPPPRDDTTPLKEEDVKKEE